MKYIYYIPIFVTLWRCIGCLRDDAAKLGLLRQAASLLRPRLTLDHNPVGVEFQPIFQKFSSKSQHQ